MMDNLPPLPEPASHGHADDGPDTIVMYYTAEQMLDFRAAGVAAERTQIATKLLQMDAEEGLHSYYRHAAWVLFQAMPVEAAAPEGTR